MELSAIEREALRQMDRKQVKKAESNRKKKENFYKSLNKKKKVSSDIISVAEYKKLNDDSAKGKAYSNLKRWFHILVKLRDLFINTDGKIWGKCIYCGRIWNVEFYSDKSILNTGNWSACHFFRADLFSSIEFDEFNVHLGCNTCNRYAGDLSQYKDNLIKKIGMKEFEALERRKNNPHSLNILEMIKLKKKFEPGD